MLPEQKARQSKTNHAYCDGATEMLLYASLILGPWLFGSTPAYAVWVQNGAGYLLGLLLLAKWLIRWRTGYRPGRWDNDRPVRNWAERGLAVGTLLILAYDVLSAWNARADFHLDRLSFEYFDNYIPWLPHSYDRHSTWFFFWQHLGLACGFWALRDWLLGQTRGERAAQANPEVILAGDPILPERVKRLLWVLCINGALLAVESILQRLSGSNKLLWLIEPRWNVESIQQFGPFAYRGNASQYFNLLWPVCFGFWWALQQALNRSGRQNARMGSSAHVILLPAALIMAASPIVALSRGGAIVAFMVMFIITFLLVYQQRKLPWHRRLLLLAPLAAFGILVSWLGLKELAQRVSEGDTANGRQEIYRNAGKIAVQFPVYGTGPGSFAAMYQLYREGTNQDWFTEVHDDWLEARITYGWVGMGLILAVLGCVVMAIWRGGPLSVHSFLVFSVWLAMAGCLLHAKVDFPFQIHSVFRLFLVMTCLAICFGRTQRTRANST